MSSYFGEFIGTMILIAFGGGVVAGSVLKGTKSENNGWLIICLAWGGGVAFAVYAVGDISGAHLNPAVTLGLALSGQFGWEKVGGYIVAQILGAFSGAVIVRFHYGPHWSLTQNTESKLAIFCTGPAIRHYPSNLLSEIIGTFILLFGLMFLGANSFSDGLNPLVIGALISAIGFSFGGTTGFAINPARDLGPRIAHFLLPIPGKGSSDWAYSWIPVFGPLVGGTAGCLTYQAFFKGHLSPLLWLFDGIMILVALISLLSKNKTLNG
jgi:glycerol uptake facilitator protein